MSLRTLAALFLALTLPVFAEDAAPKPSDADAKAKAEAVKAALKNPDAAAKIAALEAAGGCPHAVTAGSASLAMNDPDDTVRIAAAGALGRMKGLEPAARALHMALNANLKKPEVAKAIFKAIGTVNHLTSVAIVSEFADKRVPLKDEKESDLAVAAINTLAELKHKAAVEALLNLYKQQVGIGMGCSNGIHSAPYSAISGGLKTLTGQTFNSLPGEADAWWRKNKDRFNEDMTERKK